MFTKIKNFFASLIFDGGDTLMNTYEPVPIAAVAMIKPKGGNFILVDRYGQQIKSYTRRRDAVRGARRMGLEVVA